MKTLSVAKHIIAEEFQKSGLNALQILLFGSRARGDFDNRSDWDFFPAIDKELTFDERQEIARRIRWRLARAGLASDVIIRSASAVSKARYNTGCLANYAFKEGIALRTTRWLATGYGKQKATSESVKMPRPGRLYAPRRADPRSCPVQQSGVLFHHSDRP